MSSRLSNGTRLKPRKKGVLPFTDDKLQALVVASVKQAIILQDLEKDGEILSNEAIEKIALKAADAVCGVDTCAGTFIPEWKALDAERAVIQAARKFLAHAKPEPDDLEGPNTESAELTALRDAVARLSRPKVFRMKEGQFVAGYSLKSVQEWCLNETCLAERVAFDHPGALTQADMIAWAVSDDTGSLRSFRVELERLFNYGSEFPCFFAVDSESVKPSQEAIRANPD